MGSAKCKPSRKSDIRIEMQCHLLTLATHFNVVFVQINIFSQKGSMGLGMQLNSPYIIAHAASYLLSWYNKSTLETLQIIISLLY